MNANEKIQKLVHEFADAVIQQTDIMLTDPKTGNKHARRGTRAWQKLREYGDAGRDALLPLLWHERQDVRVSAAAVLLRHRTSEALALLRTEAQGKGLTSLGALQCIKNWEKGEWYLDPED